MRQTTLAVIFNPDRNKILLCMKKRGFGEGWWNGPGGKLEAGETIEQGMIREIKEEIGIEVHEENMKNIGVLHFYFKNKEEWDQDVNLFEIEDYNLEPVESEEMRPKWFDIADIPYDKMWKDDSIWLPRVINKEHLEYDFQFSEDGKEIEKYTKIK